MRLPYLNLLNDEVVFEIRSPKTFKKKFAIRCTPLRLRNQLINLEGKLAVKALFYLREKLFYNWQAYLNFA